ncbi:MAG: MBL fold metallo-hydrolase [Candidatus Geothermincolia bacterium]
MTMSKSVEVAWYGQAMFSISSPGVTVVLDPTPPETGYSYEPLKADVVLVTHTHYDHNYLDGVTGNPKVINASGTFDLAGLKVQGFDTFHDSRRGAERGPNIVYTWEQSGVRLGHFGDLGHTPSHDVIKKLLRLDVAMIPVGGVFTIDAEQAVRLVHDLEPRIVLPMHFGTVDGVVPVEPVDEFVRRFQGTVHEVAGRPVEIASDSLPTETEVWVLPYK